MMRLIFLFFFIFAQTLFRVMAQTPGPTVVCDQCANQALVDDLAADDGVTNTSTLEGALAEKLWNDKKNANVLPTGIKEFDLGLSKTLSEDQVRDFLKSYSPTQRLVIAMKILTPGSNEMIENCYKSCGDFNAEMTHLYEGNKAGQFALDLFKFELESYYDWVYVDPIYGDPTLSPDRNVQITMTNQDGGPLLQVTNQNLLVVESDGNTKIPALVDGAYIKSGTTLYQFKLEDAGKPGVLGFVFKSPDFAPYCDKTHNDDCPKTFQIIFPPEFTPTPGLSSHS
jgi:hypothetical protein